MKKLYFLFVISLFLAIHCAAQVIIVDANGTGDYPTIQEGIDVAEAGDTVIVIPGTYTGSGNRDLDFGGKAIIVRSTDPNDPNIVSATIIDCQGSAIDPHRGFCFDSNEDANSVLDGFTITNGYPPGIEDNTLPPPLTIIVYWGGAIFCDQSDPTIANCVLIGNEAADEGGAIYCKESFPDITNCTLSDNTAGWAGGAIYCGGSSPTITSCTFSNNSAYKGGALCGSSPTVINCDFIGNQGGLGGSGSGGAICNSAATLINCLFSGNAAKYGGVVQNSGGHLSVTGCTFIGNSATYGGALRFNHSSVSVNQSLFVSNSATDYGGALTAIYTDMELINSTIYGNSVNNYGGGVYVSVDSIGMIRNSIIWDNSAQFGPDVCVRFPGDAPYSSTLSIFFSDIKGGESGVYADPQCTLIWDYDGNIETDPCFADANNYDFHLKSEAGRWDPQKGSWVIDSVTSRCIDAGDPAYDLGNEPQDNNNIRINMGAYGGTAEASKTPAGWSLFSDITNDGAVDSSDLRYHAENWLDSETAFGDLNGDGKIDLVDFAILANNWDEQTSWH
jgi:predicted outer membrane repeat protein